MLVESGIEKQVAGYHLQRRIGAGASGTVFAAEDSNGRKAAVKIIHRHLTRKETVREIFLQATAQLISLEHPGVLPVLMAGQLEGGQGQVYVVSELAQGQPLTDLMTDMGPLSVEESVPLLMQLTHTLEKVHGMGLIHGNLSPENIWVKPARDGGRGELQVMDFCMSLLHRPGTLEEEARPPYYLSPEQIKGEVAEVSTDVYALGVIAFQMLTGRLPFSSPRPTEVLLMHLNEDPPPPGEIVPMSPEAELFLFQVLSKQTSYRYKDMTKVREALEQLLKPSEEASSRSAHAAGQREGAPGLTFEMSSGGADAVQGEEESADDVTPVHDADVISETLDSDALQEMQDAARLAEDTAAAVLAAEVAVKAPAPSPATNPATGAAQAATKLPTVAEPLVSPTATATPSTGTPGRRKPSQPISMEDNTEVSGQIEAELRPEPSRSEKTPVIVEGAMVFAPPPGVDPRQGEPAWVRGNSALGSTPASGRPQVRRGPPRSVGPESRPSGRTTASTDVLPSLDLPAEPGVLSHGLSALLGIITALCLGLVSFRLLTGTWPYPLGF